MTGGAEYAIFVCGTPSDRRGLEGRLLHGEMTGAVTQRMEDPQETAAPAPGARSLTYEKVPESEGGGALFKDRRGIRPSDGQGNRGAHVTVGCWVTKTRSQIETARIIAKTQQIHRELEGLRDEHCRFRPDFSLRAYKLRAEEDCTSWPPRSEWGPQGGTGDDYIDLGGLATTLHLCAQGKLGAMIRSADAGHGGIDATTVMIEQHTPQREATPRAKAGNRRRVRRAGARSHGRPGRRWAVRHIVIAMVGIVLIIGTLIVWKESTDRGGTEPNEAGSSAVTTVENGKQTPQRAKMDRANNQ